MTEVDDWELLFPRGRMIAEQMNDWGGTVKDSHILTIPGGLILTLFTQMANPNLM